METNQSLCKSRQTTIVLLIRNRLNRNDNYCELVIQNNRIFCVLSLLNLNLNIRIVLWVWSEKIYSWHLVARRTLRTPLSSHYAVVGCLISCHFPWQGIPNLPFESPSCYFSFSNPFTLLTLDYQYLRVTGNSSFSCVALISWFVSLIADLWIVDHHGLQVHRKTYFDRSTSSLHRLKRTKYVIYTLTFNILYCLQSKRRGFPWFDRGHRLDSWNRTSTRKNRI